MQNEKSKRKSKELIFKVLTIMLNTPYNNEYDKKVFILLLIGIPVSIALYTMMRPSKKVKK